MGGFDDPGFFGARWAEVYDDWYPAEGFGTDATVEFLAGLAGGGRVLELAVGTGRVAVPLAARGLVVDGVEASAAMIGRLRAKPGGERITVTAGDMADVPVLGPYRLVYLVFNALFSLLSAERQADCFRNAARVLEPEGAFVVECFVPDPGRFERGQQVEARAVTEDSATIQLFRHDAAAQRYDTQKITFDATGFHLLPGALRYSWPSELDLMAGMAGLRLAERYADWQRRSFDSGSTGHVSVYRPA